MKRYRRLLSAIAAVVTIGVVIPMATASSAPPSLSAGGSTQVTCASGSTISIAPQSSSSVKVSCSAQATTTTTRPTTTTTAPPVTTTTGPAPTTTTTQPSAPPSTGPALLGLWNNGTSASQLGVTEQVVSDYAYGTNSTTYAASGAQAAKGKLLMLGVGALTPAQATAIGTILAQNGQPDAVIRPMWEMNQGGWFPAWNEKSMSAAVYKATWISMVNAFRAVPGSAFRFDYNITAGTGSNISGRANFDSFPGAAYTDFIGVDVYDNNGSVAASQADITEAATFAQSVGLQWTIPEWGLVNKVDDPAFVNMIFTVANLPTCYMEALFSGLSSGSGTPITADPNSLAAYKANAVKLGLAA